MILKGTVEQIVSETEVKVRIPQIDGEAGASTSTETSNLNTAKLCIPSGIYPNLIVGDDVFIGFDSNTYSDPIVLGKIFNSADITKYNNKPDIIVSNLTAIQTVNLSSDTNIGKVSSKEISYLSGATDNIQAQLNFIYTKLGMLDKISDIIDVKPDFTITNFEGTYDKQSHTFTVEDKTQEGQNPTYSYSIDGINYSPDKPSFINCGTYTIYVKAVLYSNTKIEEATVIIHEAALSVVWDTTPIVYSGQDETPSCYLSGVMSGDDVNIEGITILHDGVIVTESIEVGTYTATVTSISGEDYNQYVLSSGLSYTYEIQPAGAEDWGRVDNLTSVYDGQEHSISIITSNMRDVK